MKTEKPGDKNFLNHDFTAPWSSKISYEEWKRFLSHNFDDPERILVYDIVNNNIINKFPVGNKIKTAEIGFGQCYDFTHYFQKLIESNIIDYTGYEVTKQFVEFAKHAFPKINFIQGSFSDLQEKSYDVVYTRHVFEHQHPNNGYSFYEKFLNASKRFAVVIWFVPPGEERLSWNNRDGFKHEGAYVNRYDRDKLSEIEKRSGFKHVYTFKEKNQISVYERI